MSTQVFQLPDLGEGLTEADLVNWLVEEGQVIEVDQLIAEVETAKALVEVPSPYAGTVLTLHGKPGDTLAVGAALITVGHPGDAVADDDGGVRQPGALHYREEERAGMSVPEESSDQGSGNVLIGYGTAGNGSTGRTRARKRAVASVPNGDAQAVSNGHDQQATAPRVISPLVRQLARRHGIDVRQLRGSGDQGIVLRADVQAAIDHMSLAAAETAPAEPQREAAPSHDARSGLTITERLPVKGVRRMIADQMVRSRTHIPEATAWLDVDVTELVELRTQLKTHNPETAPTLLALIARFTIAALRRYPIMNSRLMEADDGEEIVHFDGVNLGVAAQTDRGLVVPSIYRAERYSARQLSQEIAELVAKARDGRSTPEELTRGTFTLNNYGVFGTDGAAAIINAPEVAILGVGRIIDRPWVVDGELAVRKVTELTLSFDHRVTDGGTASAFLTTIAHAMQHPGSAIADL